MTNNNWCFWVDYRGLNAKMAKGKYPIPMIDELLKQFHGAQYFTKLDLHSGYFQIWMYATNISNFYTHPMHFEFLVMSFNLTNALLHFRLMNDVFGPSFHKLILMFFMILLSTTEHGVNMCTTCILLSLYCSNTDYSWTAPNVPLLKQKFLKWVMLFLLAGVYW